MPGSIQTGSGSENALRNEKVGSKASRGPGAGSRPDFERGGERVQTDTAPGHEQRSFQTPPGRPEEPYDPSAGEASREREQGLGMGERDLERQRDPRRPAAPPDEADRPDGE